MSALPLLKTAYITAEEYIEMEIASEVKHEYCDGEIFAMAGAPAPHNVIAMNLAGRFYSHLRGSSCAPFGSDQRVKVVATGLRTYPDLSIACEPRFEDKRQLDLLNPVAIFEILSPGTTAYDRGGKFRHYRQIPSLQEYFLLEQGRPHVEHFIRQNVDSATVPHGGWLLLEYDGLDAQIQIAAISCTLKIADIYERIHFESEKASDAERAERLERLRDQ